MRIKIFAALITFVCAVLLLSGIASAAFATSEAGISAYVNVGTSINLDQAAGVYKIIEDRTSTYVIGIVAVPNATDYELPHVYTSSDGWVMAYYSKEQPRALIMPWGQFDRNNPDLSLLNNTRLEEAISKVSGAIGVAYPTIKSNTKYYDFQYPDANGLTLIAESRAIDGVDSFRFRIPSEFTLYNASWEYYSYGSNTNGSDGKPNSVFKLDGYVLNGTDGSFNHNSSSEGGHSRDERYFGTINGLTTGLLHEGYLSYYYLWLHAWGDEGSSNMAIVLIYKRP
ncbi:MAG: hypothetical protein O8C66_02020 [Candidatus Methanoperedens sp.]|nr:hypothetical protein [Candidatus Methanoperedens sp.]MCZ7369262.1 hypothetical protein [Candidatus Methanoperedens sp.]